VRRCLRLRFIDLDDGCPGRGVGFGVLALGGGCALL